MRYKVKTLADKFRSKIGDSSLDLPDSFIINGLNWAFNELPRVPKLEKLFAKHLTFDLDANGHYKWNLNGDFRRLLDMPFLNFWTSTGGEPCRINVCNRPTTAFYEKNGLPELRKAGTPCEYTIEQEGDDIYLVFDRPLDIPMIIDYIAYGIPKPVESMDDEVDISAIAENLIISVLENVYYWESTDANFAEAVSQYLDNKALREAIFQLQKRWGNESMIILGEA